MWPFSTTSASPDATALYPPISSSHPSDPPPLFPRAATASPSAPPRDVRALQTPEEPNTLSTPRGRKQAATAAAGLVFVLASTAITRRAMRRRGAINTAALEAALAKNEGAQGWDKARALRQSVEVRARAVDGAWRASLAEQQQQRGTVVDPGRDQRIEETVRAAARARDEEGEEHVGQQGAQDKGGDAYSIATEAFALATINVFAWGWFAVAGLAWWFNVSDARDLKQYVRGGRGLGLREGTVGVDEDEETVDEFLAELMARHDAPLSKVIKEAERRTGEKFEVQG